ncbi:MAG TPA: AtpZ/AtpI family protein [Sphingomonadales bacterium]|nr:AtpZ/AtpI family protein [Sphingomonadales bacterium]
MPEKNDKARLDELARKLDALRAGETPRGRKDSLALAKAYRTGIELLAGVVIGTLIGYGLDSWLGTSPWMLILFFFLGVAAGFLNVYKAARKMDSGGPSQGGTP